jgi:hypothetical protein
MKINGFIEIGICIIIAAITIKIVLVFGFISGSIAGGSFLIGYGFIMNKFFDKG